ncbi:hypothetical protein Jiend_43560 [Micromonospora endophytica]|nr:hypothetical protein Jiend_43560 [Micromonospora endophytica]
MRCSAGDDSDGSRPGEVVVIVIVVIAPAAEAAGQYEGEQGADTSQRGKSAEHLVVLSFVRSSVMLGTPCQWLPVTSCALASAAVPPGRADAGAPIAVGLAPARYPGSAVWVTRPTPSSLVLEGPDVGLLLCSHSRIAHPEGWRPRPLEEYSRSRPAY